MTRSVDLCEEGTNDGNLKISRAAFVTYKTAILEKEEETFLREQVQINAREFFFTDGGNFAHKAQALSPGALI